MEERATLVNNTAKEQYLHKGKIRGPFQESLSVTLSGVQVLLKLLILSLKLMDELNPKVPNHLWCKNRAGLKNLLTLGLPYKP